MNEQKMSSLNSATSKRFTRKKIPQTDSNLHHPLHSPFDFTLHTFRNKPDTDPHLQDQILDCFNNLSSVLRDQTQNHNQQPLKCQKVFKRGDSDLSLPKFSSIQSGQNSINNSFFEDQNLAINEKSHYECDDQYSFNGDETERNSLKAKNTQNKSKYENLIQKIDHFLVKDFNEQNTESRDSWSKKKQYPAFQQLKQESKNLINFKRHQRQKSEKFTKILEEESTVREKLDFLSTYAESLEEENKKLKGQVLDFESKAKKTQQLEKQLFEKNIVIQFLTKELEKSNKKQLNREKSNKENSQLRTNLQKQRNTVSAVNILSKPSGNLPKYRASHHVETANEQANLQKVELDQNKMFLEGISGESNYSKSKSNSFMKKIFRKSHEVRQQLSNTKSNNLKNQNEEGFLIEILKEENSILSTKLNILYGDFQHMIDKYNQVLTEKSTCKAPCCQMEIKNLQSRYERQKILESQTRNLYSQNLRTYEDDHENSLMQIRSILGQITNNPKKKQLQRDNSLFEHAEGLSSLNEDQLFSKKDFEKILIKQKEQSSKVDMKNYQTERSALVNEARRNISEFDQIKKSFKNGQHYRFSVQVPENQNHSHAQRFSTLVNKNSEELNKTSGYLTNLQDLRDKQRQRVVPRGSNLENPRQRVNSWGVK